MLLLVGQTGDVTSGAIPGSGGAGDTSSAFQDILRDPDGDALRPRMTVRLQDGMNLCPYSGDQTSGGWGNYYLDNLGIVSGAPIGTGRIWVAESAIQWSRLVQDVGSLDYTDAQTVTISAVIRKYNAPRFMILFYSLTDTTSLYQYFNFDGWVPSESTASNDGAGVEDLEDNNWYRVWFKVNLRSRELENHAWSVRVYPQGDGSVSGDGTTISHIQVEKNRDLSDGAPTAYVVTQEDPVYNQPGTPIYLNNMETQISLNPIEVMRERNAGVLQSQDWQAVFTHETLALINMDLNGCWVVLEGGFPNHASVTEWALLAQGIIYEAKATTDMRVSLKIKDPLRGVLEQALDQDYYFQDTGWLGDITAKNVSEDSSDYDIDASGAGIIPSTWINQAEDGIYQIIFTAGDTYKVVFPGGSEQTNMKIYQDEPLLVGGSLEMAIIKAVGWDQDSGAYTIGDIFEFSGSVSWGTNNLNPAFLIWSILASDKFMNMQVFDVLTGKWYDRIVADYPQWQTAFVTYNTARTKGLFPKGTDYVEIIQKMLKLIHAAIFTLPNGQIALWEFLPVEEQPELFNGDPNLGEVTIESGDVTDSLNDVANVVTYKYLTLVGKRDASYTTQPDQDSVNRYGRRHKTIDLRPLEVNGTAVAYGADRWMARSKDNRRKYSLLTTMAGAIVGVEDAIGITEPMLNLIQQRCEVTRTELDVMANKVRLLAHVEPVLLEEYARVGTANTSPVGDQVGGLKKVW